MDLHDNDLSSAIEHRRMLIGGRWLDAASGAMIEIENPARKVCIAKVPRAAAADVHIAVRAARSSFLAWSKRPPRERGKLLLQIAEAIESRVEELARTIALETGNAIRNQARPEATMAVDIFRYFGGLASELKGETVPLGETVLSYSLREPLGVVAAIVPWNAPVLLAALKIAPALCAGNTIVVKAAEDAPLAVLLVGEICQQYLPDGVLNILSGYGEECGGPLLRHPMVAKLSFTGSTAVGKMVMAAAADRILPVSLELGGKSPSIVFPDADEDWAAEGVMAAMRFTRQGQSCTAGSRLLLHHTIFDSFIERLISKCSSLRIGDPLDESTDMGAIINQKQFQKVCAYTKEGASQAGASLVLGGVPFSEGPLSTGYFMPPTIFTHDSNTWRLAREEIFGPVLVAIPWKDEDAAIAMANDSHYGLAAYVWTHDLSKALRTAHAIEAGWVQVNQGTGQALGQSYGGAKQSGIGREFSLEGMLDSFTQRKSVTVNLTH